MNLTVTLVALAHKKVSAFQAGIFIIVQVAGCCAGAVLAHLMFELPLVQSSMHARVGMAQWIAEIVATAGLVLVAFVCVVLVREV